MRTFVSIYLVILSICTPCFAQISIGPRLGLNITDIKELGFNGSGDLFNPKISYHAGGFIKIPTSEKVFLMSEVVYSRKGSRLRDQFGNRFNLGLNYLAVPILIGIQLSDWSVVFGAEVGINLGDRLNSAVDVGLAGGIKYYLSEKVQLGIRFVQGLTSLNNVGLADGGGVTGLNRLRNQAWQLSISHDLFEF